ncbi:MAG: thioesterase family protein [Pseudomonadota bacterium]|nr:thioesterase family protein [Pseudomonadota bacterium]
MHFDQLLDQVNSRLTQLTFPANWCQGRTAFGGISAAMLYTAMRTVINDERTLLSLSTNFVGPLIADAPFNIELSLLREGKSASQIEARIIQDEKIAVIALACFEIKRDSNVFV